MNDADIIVIGSGHNGLAAALMLAEAGWKVLVLERSIAPGGAAKTAEITLPGFHHDLYATNIGLFLGSPIYARFGARLHEHGFQIAGSDRPFASVFPDGDIVGVYQDPAATLAQFERQSSADAEAWQRLLAYFDQVSPLLLPFMQMPMPSLPLARHAYKAYRTLGRRGVIDLVQMLLKSPRQFAESWFTSDKVRSLFIPWGFHLDFGPDVAGGALFPFLEVPLDYRNGMALSQGGVSHLIDSMVSLLTSMGGKVVLGRDVAKVIVKEGRAVGVRMADGEQLFARRGVIGNVTPTQMITRLLDPAVVPQSYVTKARSYRYGPGTMMIHLALDGPLSWHSGENTSRFCYVHAAPYIEDVARTYTDAVNGWLPKSPMLVVGQQSAVDPSRAPKGKHTLWIQVRAVPGTPVGDAAGELTSTKWPEIKEAYADRVLNKLKAYAPDVKHKILASTVLSPGDLEADNINLVGGDSISGSHHIDQNYLFRPIPGWSRYKTPVTDLYIVGASTWPGGGLNATSGYLLAEGLLKNRRRR